MNRRSTILFSILLLAPLLGGAIGCQTNSWPERAILQTSMGAITVELDAQSAPRAVENFVRLARKGSYEKCSFHRVVADFIIQSGDPTNSGMGGTSIWSVPFPDEIVETRRFDAPGILAMANAGADQNRSQFFLTLAPREELNGRHTIFGNVVDGFDVLASIGAVEVDTNSRPRQEVQLLGIEFPDSR